MASATMHPVHVDAHLEPGLSRWLWLVKWFLAIPHVVVVSLLWAAFAVLSVFAFFAIAFTGRYPRAIFDFNVGVLRWSWRVAYYTYGALGTDRYPPFTLAEVADYPTHLEIAYPERLSRGLVLVKWWLLAIPHYVIVGLLAGGTAVAWRTGGWQVGGGLIGVLVLVAAVALTVTGRYPSSLFDLILGLNRWVLRVAAYAGLMTDVYPPFRLDLGGDEPTGTLTVSGPAAGAPAASGWTAGPVVAVVLGAMLALGAFGPLAAGAAGLVLDTAAREDGFLTSPSRTFTTSGYAIVSEDIRLEGSPGRFLGDVRVRVTPDDPSRPIFVGVTSSADAETYLAATHIATVHDAARGEVVVSEGGPPPGPPGASGIWESSSEGAGTRTVTWRPASGDWTVVVMNADGSRGVEITADAGAEIVWLARAAAVALIVGVLMVLGGIALVLAGVIRAGRRPEARTA